MKENGIKCNLIALQNFLEFQKITQGVEVKRKAKKTGRESTEKKQILNLTISYHLHQMQSSLCWK